ncbi:MAG: hypothetical protein GY722_03375 [bacterium]|nr:hypothetical protein [bacterium]
MRRVAIAAVLAALWMVTGVAAAAADPPGPTEYLSEVTEIDPAVPGIAVEIVGGDSFVVLSVDRGVVVDVVGYAGEPYLRFLADGTVEENRLSPSKYLNEGRYAISEQPDDADVDADPEWVVVAEDGSFAWHDHRTHWMNDMPPPGRGPGDQVAEGVVPLMVNGDEVDVTVISVWQHPPSSLPVVLGFTLGLFMSYAVVRRRGKLIVGVVLSLALAATIVGGVAYLSVPTETAASWSLWVFPVTSAALAGLVALGRGGSDVSRRRTLLLIAALELVGWGVAHWGWLWPAVLPTALPFWIDRFVASTVLVGAIGAAVAVIVATAAPKRGIRFSP